MNLTKVSVGDIVRVDRKGRRFLALVEEKDAETRELLIRPFDAKRNPYFTASAREVVELWKYYRPRTRAKQTKEQ
jgi:hypothetical protein